MSDSKLTLKIDEDVKEAAKQEFNVSQTVEELLRDLISGPNSAEERIDEINEEIKEHKDKITEHQNHIANLQSEKNILEAEINKQAEASTEKTRFFKIATRNMNEDKWRNPEDIPVYWKSKFDEDAETLWKLAEESSVDPAEARKTNSSGSKVRSINE